MKLTKDQIQFIEDYLIKNKVNYWDVRMELLDHIATDVQKRMDNGQTFDEALKEVHLSFGNRYKSKKLSKDQKRWIFTESIYADNTGYKKLIQSKQLEFQKALRNQIGKGLIKFFKNPLMLAIYIVFLGMLLNGKDWLVNENNFFKTVMFPLLIVSSIPLFLGFVQIKKTFRSLYLSSLTILPLFTTGLLNLSLNLPKAFIMGENKDYPYWYLLSIAAVLTPLIYVQVKLSITKFREYQKIHKIYFS